MSLFLSPDVLRENRSRPAPGAKAALDQGPVAVEPGFLFDQGAHLRSAVAYGLRERAVSKPMGMLEPGNGDNDDRGGTLHARVRFLRGHDRKAVCARRRRTAARRRS